MPEYKKILVTGATGYVGGRLISRLLEKGYPVRALGRSVAKLKNRPWSDHPGVELAAGDVLDYESLLAAAQDCNDAFYLVHSMLPGQKDFEATDRKAALNMRQATEEARVKRLIYLGGLGEASSTLSRHLKSRTEVGEILSAGKVPVTILRAGMILGSGSASFEILRYLVDRLPVMITPRWVQTLCQPIAIRNVIGYLAGCLENPETQGKTFDIGGPEILTYRKLMEIYAEEAGLKKRLIIGVPVLTPRLSSYWIDLVTPVPASIARPLAEGLRNPVVCRDNSIRQLIPQELLDARQAIRLALAATRQNEIKTHWTDAGPLPQAEALYSGDPSWAGGTLLKDARAVEVRSEKKRLWQIIVSIGGTSGWYHADWLWKLRGFLDRMFGGAGLRRGRKDQTRLKPGDALDFWRVLSVRDEDHLLLLAEMKLPGTATLEFKLISTPHGTQQLTQTAQFSPKGLWGILYWYLLLPFHHYVFSGMAKQIAKKAESLA